MQEVLRDYRAGYPLMWVTSSEEHRTEREILQTFKESDIPVYRWDVLTGTVTLPDSSSQIGDGDPLDAINSFVNLDVEDGGVLILWNYHYFMKSPEIIQAILNSIPALQSQKKAIVVLSPSVKIPEELDKLFIVEDFSLPDKQQLEEFIDIFAKSKGMSVNKKAKEKIVNAGKGLTKFEFMSALALSAETNSSLSPEIIWKQKAQLVRKNEVLELFTPSNTDTFSYIGGLELLKDFLNDSVHSPLARGVLLLGVPGTGKSAIAKALGNESNLPVISLDFGRAFGSLVGESESKIREALKIIDAMSPCILFIDEIEKGLSGIASSHATDGGTGARVFGSFLTWLNDHTSQVYVIATSNDIAKLPPEFLRAERWDAIFFVDLPTEKERQSIWKIWLDFYKVTAEEYPNDDGWTGAEIKTACRLAKMLKTDLRTASKYVVPVSRSMGEKITRLRKWATTRCVPASKVDAKAKKTATIKNRSESFV